MVTTRIFIFTLFTFTIWECGLHFPNGGEEDLGLSAVAVSSSSLHPRCHLLATASLFPRSLELSLHSEPHSQPWPACPSLNSACGHFEPAPSEGRPPCSQSGGQWHSYTPILSERSRLGLPGNGYQPGNLSRHVIYLTCPPVGPPLPLLSGLL